MSEPISSRGADLEPNRCSNVCRKIHVCESIACSVDVFCELLAVFSHAQVVCVCIHVPDGLQDVGCIARMSIFRCMHAHVHRSHQGSNVCMWIALKSHELPGLRGALSVHAPCSTQGREGARCAGRQANNRRVAIGPTPRRMHAVQFLCHCERMCADD